MKCDIMSYFTLVLKFEWVNIEPGNKDIQDVHFSAESWILLILVSLCDGIYILKTPTGYWKWYYLDQTLFIDVSYTIFYSVKHTTK